MCKHTQTHKHTNAQIHTHETTRVAWTLGSAKRQRQNQRRFLVLPSAVFPICVFVRLQGKVVCELSSDVFVTRRHGPIWHIPRNTRTPKCNARSGQPSLQAEGLPNIQSDHGTRSAPTSSRSNPLAKWTYLRLSQSEHTSAPACAPCFVWP